MTKSELLTKVEAGMAALKQSAKWAEAYESCKPYLEMISDKDAFITEALLMKLYAYLTGESGKVRTVDEVLPPRKVPKASELDHFMTHFISQMRISRQMFHPIEYAAICHKRLLEICPFEKKNELVADYILDLLLVQGGFLPMDKAQIDRMAYEAALKKAQHPSMPEIDELIVLIAQNISSKINGLLNNSN